MMQYKWIGAMLIILGCGGFGFSLAASHIREETLLRQLIGILDYMECELQFHMTPLPDLCRKAGEDTQGKLRPVFLALAQGLDDQQSSDVASCMTKAMGRSRGIPDKTADNLRLLGNSLGRFDLDGQLMGLEAVRSNCRKDLQRLTNNRDARLRSYQTLGVCAGAALAILLL